MGHHVVPWNPKARDAKTVGSWRLRQSPEVVPDDWSLNADPASVIIS